MSVPGHNQIMIRFNFELRAVSEIAPWTNGAGNDPHLSWFGLSDGHYWVTVNDVDLFRFSDDVLAAQSTKRHQTKWALGAWGSRDRGFACLSECVTQHVNA